MTRDDITIVFACRIIAWAEPTDCGVEFRAITVNGQLIVADTMALLVLGLSECAPMLMAA